ncbi:hypothetical protein QE152_g8486 [Popillia japonica]|uniref:Uncharacterized protein n=1 Tax=Popillia japonica TaxID=7064 RepID=A0AAW1MC95_POPJA
MYYTPFVYRRYFFLVENSRNLHERGLEEVEKKLSELMMEFSGNQGETKVVLDGELVENSRNLHERGLEEVEKKLSELMMEFSGNQGETKVVLDGESEIVQQRPEATEPVSSGKMILKPPIFDGLISWNNYLRQFEITVESNCWTENLKASALANSLRGKLLSRAIVGPKT